MSGGASLGLRRVARRLDPPLVNARGTWHERAALVIELEALDGHRGLGEAAPLPGYSPDTLEGCERRLRAIPGAVVGALACAEEPAQIFALVSDAVPPGLPAARFALETAALDLLARRRGEPVWRSLRPLAQPTSCAPGPVSLAALVSSVSPERSLAEVARLLGRDVRTYKLKIGPEHPTRAQLEVLSALRRAHGEAITLRLDANGTLAPGELARSWEQLSVFAPELVEEPVSPAQLDCLRSVPLPYALDESLAVLSSAEVSRALQHERCVGLVLKPTALGGFGRCLELARAAAEHGKVALPSHTFESRVGWAACAALALALAPTRAAGLYPIHADEEDVDVIAHGQLVAGARPGLGHIALV